MFREGSEKLIHAFISSTVEYCSDVQQKDCQTTSAQFESCCQSSYKNQLPLKIKTLQLPHKSFNILRPKKSFDDLTEELKPRRANRSLGNRRLEEQMESE